jgi:hypothetical protein
VGGNRAFNLTLDAALYCGCADAPVKSNGAGAMGVVSALISVLLTLMLAGAFYRNEEKRV